MERRDLEASELLRRFGIGLEHSEQAAFAEDDELAVGKDAGAAAVNFGRKRRVRTPALIAFPRDAAGEEFNAAKARVGFVAAAKAEEKTGIVKRRGPMHFQGG